MKNEEISIEYLVKSSTEPYYLDPEDPIKMAEISIIYFLVTKINHKSDSKIGQNLGIIPFVIRLAFKK